MVLRFSGREAFVGSDGAVAAPLPQKFMRWPDVLAVPLVFPFRTGLFALAVGMRAAVFALVSGFGLLLDHLLQDGVWVGAAGSLRDHQGAGGRDDCGVIGGE